MTTSMRMWMAAILALVTLTATAAPSPAAERKPVRSGTITGWGVTWVAMYNGEALDCQSDTWTAGSNPECSAWLDSGCDPALAGRNPAVTASIVDVATLADSRTPRDFRWDAITSPAFFTVRGGVVVQLWRKDCTEIESSKWRSVEILNGNRSRWNNRKSATFSIPSSARWMTVTTNDTAKLEWTLR